MARTNRNNLNLLKSGYGKRKSLKYVEENYASSKRTKYKYKPASKAQLKAIRTNLQAANRRAKSLRVAFFVMLSLATLAALYLLLF